MFAVNILFLLLPACQEWAVQSAGGTPPQHLQVTTLGAGSCELPGEGVQHREDGWLRLCTGIHDIRCEQTQYSACTVHLRSIPVCSIEPRLVLGWGYSDQKWRWRRPRDVASPQGLLHAPLTFRLIHNSHMPGAWCSTEAAIWFPEGLPFSRRVCGPVLCCQHWRLYARG